MTRYFFNVRHNPGSLGLARDPDGDEIADLDGVRAHALAVARDLIDRTSLDSIPNWFDCTFEITDRRGRAVMTVPFTDTVPDEEDESDSIEAHA